MMPRCSIRLLRLTCAALALGLSGCRLPEGEPEAEPPVPADRFRNGITVVSDDDTIRVDTGPVSFTLDRARGSLRALRVDGKDLVLDNDAPLLSAQLFESAAWDGHADHAPGRFLAAAYRPAAVEVSSDDDRVEAVIRGALEFDGGDRLPFEVRLQARADSAHLAMAIRLEREGVFRHRYLRELSLDLPLSLQLRKRVAQGGDRGLTWDTRYFYQFHTAMRPTVLIEPERNEWRIFAVDQESPRSYRLWRSESESTASLTMQRGREAAGWMAAYDREGGLLFSMRDMAEQAPKSLFFEAAEGGRARLFLHPSTAAALPLRGNGHSASVFGREHAVDLVAFPGTRREAGPERELARARGVSALRSDPPARPERLGPEDWLARTGPAQGADSPVVSGGVPLPRGALQTPAHVRVMKEDREFPVQSRALAYWPDGSVKWLLLVFPWEGDALCGLQPGRGEGEARPFFVTLRDGSREAFTLVYGEDVEPGRPERPLSIREEDGEARLDTGPLQITFAAAADWLRRVVLDGRVLVDGAGQEPLAFVDYLRGEAGGYPVATSHPLALQPDPGAVVFDRMEWEERGPLRSILRLEGWAGSEEPSRVILRAEVYAGRALVRLQHTVVFMLSDPRTTFLRHMGLRLPLALDPEETRVSVGGADGPIRMPGAGEVGLLQANHLDARAWRRDEAGVHEVAGGARAQGWIDLSDGRGGVTVVMRDMWQSFPKELRASPADGMVTVSLWPESVPVMDVRRYSDYPHRSQGETVREDNAWVRDTYYAEDPFLGTARTHEMLWRFHGGEDAGTAVAVAADLHSRPLVYAGTDAYRTAGVVLPEIDAERFPRAAANLRNVADFWLFHQDLWGWYGLWDHGDVQHRFRSGYGWILDPDILARRAALPPGQRGPGSEPIRDRILDYRPQHDWAFDNGRWGWTNTEGLPNLFLQSQYLRTGRRDLFFAAEALAQHTRDVVIRHAGRWAGRGTRHGVQHWSCGHHSERQTVLSEMRYHYYLTGEPRTRRVADWLARVRYARAGVTGSQDVHSARLYGLFTQWEMTGDPAWGERLARYVAALTTPEGVATSTRVAFPDFVRDGEPAGLNSGSMFFQTFGGMHGLLEYYYATGDPDLHVALVRMAEHALSDPDVRAFLEDRAISSGNAFWKAIGFAARHAEDPAPFRQFLDTWFRETVAEDLSQTVSANPGHWTGRTAFLRRNVTISLFWINALPYVLGALDAEPEPSAERQAAMAEIEREGLPRDKAPLSWQSEYDRPEFDDYLGPWRPWAGTAPTQPRSRHADLPVR